MYDYYYTYDRYYNYHSHLHSVKVKYVRPRLVPNAIPSKFPDVPPSCIPRVKMPRKPPKVREIPVCESHERQGAQDNIESVEVSSEESSSRKEHTSIDGEYQLLASGLLTHFCTSLFHLGSIMCVGPY